MAANTISTSFIKEYETEVKLAYQREGSLLRNTVRRKTGVIGSTADFQTYGTGVATDKARNGDVVPMNPAHATVTATLVDKYAPIYIDSLDELKINIDERGAAVKTGAWALGRVADGQIVTVLDAQGTTYDAGTSVGGFTEAKVLAALYTKVCGNDVPPGNLTVTLGWYQVAQAMALDAFVNRQYVGEEYPLLKTVNAFTWGGATFVPTSGLSLAVAGTVRYCYAYDKAAIGHAIGAEVSTEINYIAEKVSWLINSYMSQGAVLIDTKGISRIMCAEA